MARRYSPGGSFRQGSKVKEAVELVYKAAREKKRHIYETLENGCEKLWHATEDAIHSGEKKIRDTSSRVNEKVHEDPWTYVFTAAAIFFAVGSLLCTRTGMSEEKPFHEENRR